MDQNSRIIAENPPAKIELPLIESSFFHFHDESYGNLDNCNENSQSRGHFWNKVYQFPQYSPASPFFHNHAEDERNITAASSQDVWNKFNPQNVPKFEFDVFRMLKDTRATESTHLPSLEETKDRKREEVPEQKNGMMIEPKRPPAFMGAFTHVQPAFNFFNLNISSPSAQEYKPFSCFYQDENEQHEESIKLDDSSLQVSNLEVSKISAIKEIQQFNKGKYFFEIDVVEPEIVEQQELKDTSLRLSKICPQIDEPEEQKSILWNYASLFSERDSFKHRDPIWDEEPVEREVKESRIFEVYRQENLRVLHSMELQLNLAEEMREVLADSFILSEASKILQSIECDLFTLDYAKVEWSLELSKFRLEHSFRNSLKYRIKDLFILANYRSRIDIALQYIRKRPFRRVYYELGVQITEILILFQEIILYQSKNSTFIEFLLHLDKVKLEITLIYKLLINQSYIIDERRSYEDFDYRYLNSEYVIFKEIVKQSKFADSLNIQIKPLINTLLKAAFKPIISILNSILFEECTIIELNDEIYLKYFFDNHKDIVNFVSKKIGLIKEENNELYLICRIKEKMEIVHNLEQLEEYQHKWERNFARKRKLIERIRKNYKLKIKHEKEKKYEERMKFIYSLKSRIYQQNEEESAKKRQNSIRNREQLERMKKEIESRQERRKLLELLEKEKEKGLLLDIQLQEKYRLNKEKELLMKQIHGITYESPKRREPQPLALQELHPISQKAISNEEKIEILPSIPSFQQRISMKQEVIHAEPVSQDQIKSNPSLDNNKMAFTADNFLLKRQRNSSKLSNANKTESYFRLTSNHPIKNHELQSDSSDNSMQVEQQHSQSEQQFLPLSKHLQISRQIDLSTSLEICLNDIIKKQLEIVQSSLHFIIIDKYEILTIINFMKNIFMSGNGEKIQEFIGIAINENAMLNLKYFSECLLFDTNLEIIEKLEPSFYHSKNENKFNTEINIFQENIEHYIGFEFSKLPIILQPYFSYIHLSKYMQIFNFIVRVKYSQGLITRSWKLLNNYKKQLQLQQREGDQVSQELKLLKKLFSVRYIINNFLITFENYMFLKIIEKEYKIMKLNINNLHELETNHLKMLDNIIRFAFIDNPNQNISKNFKRHLALINEFYQIIYQLTLDDLPGYRWRETEQKVQMIYLYFKKEQLYVENLILKLS